jgi:hypothetical protein
MSERGEGEGEGDGGMIEVHYRHGGKEHNET